MRSEGEVAQSCLTLCVSMDYSLSALSVHGIFQARILEWVAISFSRRSFQTRDWAQVSHIVGRHFTIWASREVYKGCLFIKLRQWESSAILSFRRESRVTFYRMNIQNCKSLWQASILLSCDIWKWRLLHPNGPQSYKTDKHNREGGSS